MDVNITPALQIEERKSLSTEEFQKQLCSWLESKGLLSELRAYFRSNMIEVLKNTALGSSISSKVKQPLTPKMQGINLMISEYFLHSQYHFSLCVFCTEVSLNNILPNMNNTIKQASKQGSAFKFSEKEVYDILESIGILRCNKQAEKIYTSYCELEEPLISYFLPSNLPTSFTSNEHIQYFDNNNSDRELIQTIEELISNSNMSPSAISQLKYYISLICTKQNENQTKMAESLKGQYKTRLKMYKHRLIDIQKSFDNDKRKFQDEIYNIKQEFDNVVLENQLMKMNYGVDTPKVQNIVDVEQNNLSNEVSVMNKSTQHVEIKPKKIQKLDKEQQTLANTSLEAAVLKLVVQQLENENGILRNDNYNYCGQIDQLAQRAAILMNELNISQQHVVRLNNLLQNSPTIFSAENIPNRYQTLLPTGAGEECIGQPPRARPSVFRNLEKGKKLPPKKLSSTSDNTSRSTSPTDELLEEAKKKLKNLELESEHIDRNILTFAERYNFPTDSNQNQNQSIEKLFKFNVEANEFNGDNVFSFGACAVQNNSRTDTRCDSDTSQASYSSATTSCSIHYPLLKSEED